MAKKVLVIDDDATLLNLVKYMLEQGGFEVHTCAQGHLVWEEIAKVKPDVLVLDLMLPGVDGYALQTRLSREESTKRLPIVMMTALKSLKALFRNSPQVVAFLAKPFKPEELLKVVSEAAGKSAGA